MHYNSKLWQVVQYQSDYIKRNLFVALWVAAFVVSGSCFSGAIYAADTIYSKPEAELVLMIVPFGIWLTLQAKMLIKYIRPNL